MCRTIWRWSDRPATAFWPFESGRWPPPKEKLLLAGLLIWIGKPLFSVMMPLICHWPRIALTNPFQLAPIDLPLPNGSSYVKLATRR